MEYFERLKQIREDHDLTQSDVAQLLKTTRQQVSKWETGTAVPELDKLVRMSKLFDVSLDELVSGESPATKEAPVQEEISEPQVIYIEKPVFPTVKRQHILGAVILFCALIYGVILYEGFSMEETVSLVLPVAACGAVFLLTSHPLFWCGWICAFGYWDHFFIFFPRWEKHIFLQLLGILWIAVMFCLSISLHSRGKIRIPIWVRTAFTHLLLGLGILWMLNSPMFAWIFGY
jgi:transcriptional regulator with XRE-family HTH domain